MHFEVQRFEIPTESIEARKAELKAKLLIELKEDFDKIKILLDSDAEKYAKERGHVIWWLPPHHSDLNPIEMLWASVKGDVAKDFSSSTTMDTILARLKSSIVERGSAEAVSRLVRHTDALIEQYEEAKVVRGTSVEEEDVSDDDEDEINENGYISETSDTSEDDEESDEND